MNKRRTNRLRIILFISCFACLFWGGANSFAQSNAVSINPPALFYQAGSYYQKEDYEKAAELYNKLIAAGYESGNLYFNLGNTYYKLAKKGEAILYYEKAKQFMPNDADLRSNLNFALRSVDEGNSNWQTDFYQFIVSCTSLENLLAVNSILFFGIIAFFILFMLFPGFFRRRDNNKLKPWWLGTFVLIAIAFLAALSLGIATGIDHTRLKAVAVQSDGVVRFEPNSNATVYYPLAEGSRVQILAQKTGWVLIQRRDGKLGWIEKRFVAKI
jgi:Uncharacterized protein conserved in bacteria